MKYRLSVLLGAVSYGILSTIVSKAYGHGYTLGQVVGCQLAVGFVLAWLLVLIMHLKRRRGANKLTASSATSDGPNISQTSSTASTANVLNASAPLRDSKAAWKHRLLLMAAGMPTGLTGLLYYESLRYIPNSLAILLLFQFTWMGVLVQAIGQRRRPKGIQLITLVVLLGGTLLAAGMLDQGLGAFNGLGLFFGLASAVSYTLFILLSGKAVPAMHPARRSAWMITGALLFVFILFPPGFLLEGSLLIGLLPFGLLLGLFGAFLPPVLYAIGVPHIGGGLAGILGAAELPVAVMLSSVVLHEHVTEVQWAGVLLVLLGVALPELIRRKRGPGAPAACAVEL